MRLVISKAANAERWGTVSEGGFLNRDVVGSASSPFTAVKQYWGGVSDLIPPTPPRNPCNMHREKTRGLSMTTSLQHNKTGYHLDEAYEHLA